MIMQIRVGIHIKFVSLVYFNFFLNYVNIVYSILQDGNKKIGRKLALLQQILQSKVVTVLFFFKKEK